MGPEIAATDSFLCPSGVGSSTTQLGDLACHQMNFAASAIRPPTAMNNTAICTHRLFAKLLVFPFLICVSIAGSLQPIAWPNLSIQICFNNCYLLRSI